jgi:rhamnopyranosyl-N-acetylglucosaminyl-diphospho-decaprenol beta-1,3/1,4-galactofuranosyltransferase
MPRNPLGKLHSRSRLMRILMPNPQEHGRVVAVVVAYNRRSLLVESLRAIAAQSLPPAAVVVVDNASSDGSGDAVREVAPHADLVTLDRNTGGAGGFAAGMARALRHHDPAWIWLMDDDTIPTPTAAHELVVAAESHGAAIAGSRVVWTDGQDHPMNTPREKPFASTAERQAAATSGAMAVRSSSFVSMLVAADAVKEHGLPIAEYFIWNDDFEFSTRILRRRRGIFVPASVVVHKTKKLGSTDLDPGERFFYEVRNKLWLLLFSTGLSPFEKLVYGGSTVRRWAKTIRASRDRRMLWLQLRRGLAAGVRRRPVDNVTFLSDLGETTDEVADIEAGRTARSRG